MGDDVGVLQPPGGSHVWQITGSPLSVPSGLSTRVGRFSFILHPTSWCGSVIGNDDSGRVALHTNSAFSGPHYMHPAPADRCVFGRCVWRRQLQRGIPHPPRNGEVPLLGIYHPRSAFRAVRIPCARHTLICSLIGRSPRPHIYACVYSKG